MGRTSPHSLPAEEALLGACILSRNAIEAVLDIVVPGDFYKPAHGLIFNAITHLYKHGDPVDPVTIMDELSRHGQLEVVGGPHVLIELQSNTPSTSSAARYARTVADHSVLRKVIAVSSEAMEAAYGLSAEAESIVESARNGFSEALSGQMSVEPEGLWVLDDFLDRPLEDRPQWIIPGLIRRGWRVMMVAAEGSGKTVLFRQIGMAAAQGIHPLHFEKVDPCRVLIVDLENPEDSIHDVCHPIQAQTKIASIDYDSDRAYLWHRPGGINLRSRRDRMDLETVIAASKPDLVCLGPIYKAYNVNGNESDELAAKEVMQCFDDLRTRYNFSLLLEHHAPKGQGKSRDLVPYGSSLWLRWPEVGLKMYPTDSRGDVMKIGRWRGDRLENSWPEELHRSKPWLWEGVWPAGTFTEPGHPKPPTVDTYRQKAPPLISSSSAPYPDEDDYYDDYGTPPF